jgi:hypothetical protein
MRLGFSTCFYRSRIGPKDSVYCRDCRDISVTSHEMSVSIYGHRCLAEPSLNSLGVNVVGEPQSGSRVAKVVNRTAAAQPGVLSGFVSGA